MEMNKKDPQPKNYKDGREITGTFGKKDEDIKDGDLVSFVDAGGVVDGQYGDQKVFEMKTPQGNFLFNLNQTSENNLVEFLGNDSEKWKGQTVKACLTTENVAGTMRRVIYLVHPDGDLINPVPKAQGT